MKLSDLRILQYHKQIHTGMRFCAILLISLLLSSCSSFNCTPLESTLGGSTNLISFSYKIAENLVDRAVPPLLPRHPEMPILVTTFVDNNDLRKTSQFGRVLQEHISSGLVQLGYTVREIKLAENLNIIPGSGETILTRDLTLLNPGQEVQALLVGTVSHTNRTLYVSARLINPHNSNIISTDDYQLCMDDDILNMLGMQRLHETDRPVQEPHQSILNRIF